jgi:hypothetical protein
MSINSPGSPQFGMYRGVPTPPIRADSAAFRQLLQENSAARGYLAGSGLPAPPFTPRPQSTDGFARGLMIQQQSPLIAPKPVAHHRPPLPQQRLSASPSYIASGNGSSRLSPGLSTNVQRTYTPSLSSLAEHPPRSDSPIIKEIEPDRIKTMIRVQNYDHYYISGNGYGYMVSKGAGELLQTLKDRGDQGVVLSDVMYGDQREREKIFSELKDTLKKVGTSHRIQIIGKVEDRYLNEVVNVENVYAYI